LRKGEGTMEEEEIREEERGKSHL